MTSPILTTLLWFRPKFLENSSPIPAIVNLFAYRYATMTTGILMYNNSYLPSIISEKSPCSHDDMFCTRSCFIEKNVVIELIMFPSIKPTSGINIASLNFIRFSICMNTNVPSNAKTKATSIFTIGVAVVNIISAIRMPNLAQSIVPAVVGDTNLFLVICCIISPQMLKLIPAIIILIRRGNLLINKISF